MNPTIDIVRGELERLFTLEEMTKMSERLLGLAPSEVGGDTAKGSFALALTERCFDGDRIDALVDVIVHSRKEVDPRVRDVVRLLGTEDLSEGQSVGDFSIEKKIGESELGVVYRAVREDGDARALYALHVLRREAVRDRRAVHRFLTANRLLGTVDHAGLPRHLEAGELERGIYYVAYQLIDAQPLSARMARTGPLSFEELGPVLRGVLEPLAAVHKAHLTHGDLKAENILVSGSTTGDSDLRVHLVDFGTDRLRASGPSGQVGPLAVYGSPKTVAPEIVRGRSADARSDVYAFGAVLYELLTGKPVFAFESAADAAFAHLTMQPEPPSRCAPRGAVSSEVDAFVLSLLNKDAALRPKDASAVLDALDSLGRASMRMRAAGAVSVERIQLLVDALLAAPSDVDVALNLENLVEQGADPTRVAEAFAAAAAQVRGDSEADPETKKALLFRAARTFHVAARDKERAEEVYAAIVEIDPQDDVALNALEDIRKALGKYEELVEMLLAKSQAAPAGEARGQALAEIGRLYVTELDDPEQALVAYVQALCEEPSNDEYASEVERLSGARMAVWTEQLDTIGEILKSGTLAQTDYLALLGRVARWYEQKLGRADMALAAYQQLLAGDPGNDSASEGMTAIYRKAQQWPELVGVLMARADVAASAPKARDLRAEAAEIFETRLNDLARARDILSGVLSEDPGHARATDAMARICERSGDFVALAHVLERRAEARRGVEKAEALVRVAEVYEEHLADLPEATRLFEAALALDRTNLNGLKGLDRVFNRTGKMRELLEVLERQIEVAATPRQKIALYQRIASIHDEEFLNHEAAVSALESMLALDPSNDGALTALARHFRALEKWEQAASIYDKHASVTADPARKVELMVARARTLAEQIGSPERATKAYEQVLALQPAHAGALEALAHLRETSGDAHAALTAIEALAAKAVTPEARAEQWMRAARLLEARGDKDSAIERYKLALDAHPKDAAASAALRKAYASRADWLSVVGLIERELQTAESDLARGRLWAELSKVHHAHLVDAQKAETAAKRALELDGSNADALMVLGDLAFEAGRMLEASKFYDSLVTRTGVLGKDDAVRVLVRFMEAFGKAQARPTPASSANVTGVTGVDTSGPPSGLWVGGGPVSQSRISVAPMPPATIPPPPVTNPRMLQAVDALKQLAPQDVGALSRAANALFEFGDPVTALGMHEDLFRKYDSALAGSERAEALFHLGESARRAGNLDAAIAPLRESIELEPSNPRPYRALAKVFDEKGAWDESVSVRRSRLQLASGNERFELLLEIGDVLFVKLGDRAGASKVYTEALEERPDDRKLLAKLMQLYSEEKDWAKVVEVVLRLADFVDNPKQRAKYMHTAATISSRHLGDADKALEFFERALELEPSNDKALAEAIELYRSRGAHERVEALLKVQLDQAKLAQDRERIVLVLDKLAEVYEGALKEPDLAIDALEAAQAFDPEDRTRAERLAELYAADPGQYLDKAVSAQLGILRKNPYRVESYKLLRRLFTDSKKADPAWCLCQALSTLRLAEADEERFYRKHRAESAAPAQATVDEDGWSLLMHWDLDPLLTRIFAMIQPTISRVRTQPLEQLGFDSRYAIDTSRHPYPASQTIHYVQGVLAIGAPLVFQNPNEGRALSVVHARNPAIVLGQAAFDNTMSNQGLAFAAGRQLAALRAGFYVRQLVPTGTGLKAWLFAAIKLCVPQFPISSDLAGQVDEALAALGQDFTGTEREKLASAVSKLLQAGGSLDLKKWVAAVDLTVDRVGLLLAHDLQIATEMLRASEEASSVPVKERLKELVLFSVSEEYFALRQKLAITIEG
jgi:tetratricopeptide (TPR) repeat protein